MTVTEGMRGTGLTRAGGITDKSFFFFFFLAMPCGMQDPDQGSNPRPLTVEERRLNHWTAREVPWTSLELTGVSSTRTAWGCTL